uniref:Uncharacterized protein n=1 Tax=Cacopsylla melanoneura TaxID=428564 RepID=A0A8D9F1F1_9HEMI
MDTEGFQEEFLLETPDPEDILKRHIARLEEELQTPLLQTPLSLQSSSRETSPISQNHLKNANQDRKDIQISQNQSPNSPLKSRDIPSVLDLDITSREQDVKDEKRKKQRFVGWKTENSINNDVDKEKTSEKIKPSQSETRISPVDTTSSHSDQGTSPIQFTGHIEKGSSPVEKKVFPAQIPESRNTPPTFELVLGRKEIHTKDASASSESRLTLYSTQDVDITIRSESHISVTTTRKEADGTQVSETIDMNSRVTAENQEKAYIISPETNKEKKREDTVIFSSKKSVYRYDSQDAVSPNFESPITDESVSHHMTDLGISLTRGTATTTSDTLTSPALLPPRVVPFYSDTAVDIELEEAELTDAGLSPIHNDDSSSMDIAFSEVTRTQYTDTASSPMELKATENVALSPVQVMTSDTGCVTETIYTCDTGISPIDAGSFQPLPEIPMSTGDVKAIVKLIEEKTITQPSDVKRSLGLDPLKDNDNRERKISTTETVSVKESVIQSTVETESSEDKLDSNKDKALKRISINSDEESEEDRRPKVKELQKIFLEKEDNLIKVSTALNLEQDLDEYDDLGFPKISTVIDSIEKRIADEQDRKEYAPPKALEEQLNEVVLSQQQILQQISGGLSEKIISDIPSNTKKKSGMESKLQEILNIETNALKKIDSALNRQYDSVLEPSNEDTDQDTSTSRIIDESKASDISSPAKSVEPDVLKKIGSVLDVGRNGASTEHKIDKDVVCIKERTMEEIIAQLEAEVRETECMEEKKVLDIDDTDDSKKNVRPDVKIKDVEIIETCEKRRFLTGEISDEEGSPKKTKSKCDAKTLVLDKDIKTFLDEENELVEKILSTKPQATTSVTSHEERQQVVEEVIVPKKVKYNANEKDSENLDPDQQNLDLDEDDDDSLDSFISRTEKISNEKDVRTLLSYAKEFTRQIKEDVKLLRPDLTPTPEEKEILLLKLSESYEMLNQDTKFVPDQENDKVQNNEELKDELMKSILELKDFPKSEFEKIENKRLTSITEKEVLCKQNDFNTLSTDSTISKTINEVKDIKQKLMEISIHEHEKLSKENISTLSTIISTVNEEERSINTIDSSTKKIVETTKKSEKITIESLTKDLEKTDDLKKVQSFKITSDRRENELLQGITHLEERIEQEREKIIGHFSSLDDELTLELQRITNTIDKTDETPSEVDVEKELQLGSINIEETKKVQIPDIDSKTTKDSEKSTTIDSSTTKDMVEEIKEIHITDKDEKLTTENIPSDNIEVVKDLHAKSIILEETKEGHLPATAKHAEYDFTISDKVEKQNLDKDTIIDAVKTETVIEEQKKETEKIVQDTKLDEIHTKVEKDSIKSEKSLTIDIPERKEMREVIDEDKKPILEKVEKTPHIDIKPTKDDFKISDEIEKLTEHKYEKKTPDQENTQTLDIKDKVEKSNLDKKDNIEKTTLDKEDKVVKQGTDKDVISGAIFEKLKHDLQEKVEKPIEKVDTFSILTFEKGDKVKKHKTTIENKEEKPRLEKEDMIMKPTFEIADDASPVDKIEKLTNVKEDIISDKIMTPTPDKDAILVDDKEKPTTEKSHLMSPPKRVLRVMFFPFYRVLMCLSVVI